MNHVISLLNRLEKHPVDIRLFVNHVISLYQAQKITTSRLSRQKGKFFEKVEISCFCPLHGFCATNGRVTKTHKKPDPPGHRECARETVGPSQKTET